MKIITITLNPAFDIHCNIESLKLYKENYVSNVVKHAGGKGINISRALRKFNIDNTACCVIGSSGGDEFLNLIHRDNITCKPIMVEGAVRENLTVHSHDGETRISFEGIRLDENILNELLKIIKREREDNMIVTFTGRLCEGVTKNMAVDFLIEIKNMNAKIIVDCNSFGSYDLARIKPFLIKPNEQEISELINKEIADAEDALIAAEMLCKQQIENVIISLGEKGFVFCGESGKYIVKVPPISAVSTIGAGDSLIAGFIMGMSQNKEIVECLKLSAAFGTAACLTEGTNPPMPDMVNKIFSEIVCEKVNF